MSDERQVLSQEDMTSVIDHMRGVEREMVFELQAEVARLQEMLRWIPVTDRLPDDCKYVLLYLDHRDGHGGEAVGYCIKGEFWLYEGDNIRCDEAGVDATHWMPLPPPPENANPHFALTDEEREAVKHFAKEFKGKNAAVLRGLLERLG